MTPLIVIASGTITLALVSYTIGVFGERRAGTLTSRHLAFFWTGFIFDTAGTTVMSKISSEAGGGVAPMHAVSGALALGLMAFHAVWATIILIRRNERRLAGFHRFSVVVWLFWLVPYFIGMLLGIPAVNLSNIAIIAVSLVAVVIIAAVLNLGPRAAVRISKENLLVIAGIVWLIAGINVANLGIRSAFTLNGTGLIIAALFGVGGVAVFLAFHAMFGRIVKKNSARIRALVVPAQSPLRFLDAKGYIIMAVMMGGGFGARAAGLAPDWFVAFFYTGLGIALALTGVGFLMHRARGEGWTFHAKKEFAA